MFTHIFSINSFYICKTSRQRYRVPMIIFDPEPDQMCSRALVERELEFTFLKARCIAEHNPYCRELWILAPKVILKVISQIHPKIIPTHRLFYYGPLYDSIVHHIVHHIFTESIVTEFIFK